MLLRLLGKPYIVLVVPQGTRFSAYVAELRLLLANVQCVGQVAHKDSIMPIAVKAGVDEQVAGLGA